MFINLMVQSMTLFNFFFNTYILFLLTFFGYFLIASEGFLVVSLINIFTQGFSANIRNIYLGTKNAVQLRAIIQFRISVFIFAFPLNILIVYFLFGASNIFFHSSLILLTFASWILDLLIARIEKNYSWNVYLIFNQVLVFILFSIFIYTNNIFLATTFILIYCLVNLLIFRNYLKNIFFINLLKNKQYFNLAMFSTFLKTITNFAWRYFAILLVGKVQSSILFLGFSLGSVFATIFDVSYGAHWLKKIANKNLFINFLFLSYCSVIIAIIYIFEVFSKFDNTQSSLFLSTVFFSVLGSYFLVFALQKRQALYEVSELRRLCYNYDIGTYIFNFLIIPVLYYLNASYLSLSYLVSSLFCYSVFITFFYNAKSKKII